MDITEVKVFPVREEKLKAFVSIVFDGCFMVNDIKVIRGKDGLFISMPSRKKKNGEFKDVAHPLNNDTRRRIEQQILDEYERVLEERGESPEVGRRRLELTGPQPQDTPEDDADGRERQSALAAALQSPVAAHPAATSPARTEGPSAADLPLAAAAESSDRAGEGARDPGSTSSPAADRVGDEVREIHPMAARGAGDSADAVDGERAPVTEPQSSGRAADASLPEGSEGGRGDDPERSKSLEEVEAMHLRDSFWSVG